MRSSPHAGSKPGFTHITDVARDRPFRIARAQAWSHATGRPVPPHMRFRSPLQPAVPLGIRDRHNRYAKQNDAEDMTPAQVRRARHKHGRRELETFARQRKMDLASPQPQGPRRPGTPAQLRRAKKDAAQKARHAARIQAAR